MLLVDCSERLDTPLSWMNCKASHGNGKTSWHCRKIFLSENGNADLG